MKIPKSITRITAVVFGTIACIGAVFAAGTLSTDGSGNLQFDGTNVCLADGSNAYDYVIYKEGNNFKAKNNSGAVEFSNTDSDTVIDSVLSAVDSNGGGYVLIKAGEYNTTFTVPDNTILEGEGEKTILYAPTGSYSHQSYLRSNAIIRNLQLNGKYKQVTGVYVYAGTGVHIRNFKVENVFFNGTSSAVSVNGADTTSDATIRYGQVLNNIAKDVTQFGGVEGNQAGDFEGTSDIVFRGNIVYNATGSEFFDYNHGTNVHLINNIFVNDNTSYLDDEAIDMNGNNPGAIVKGNTIVGCFARGIRPPKKNSIIEGNYIEFIACTEKSEANLIDLWNGGPGLNHSPSFHTVSNNVLKGGANAINLAGASHNTVTGNTIINSKRGIN